MFQTKYDKEAKLWRGRDCVPLFNPKISIAQVVLKACVNYGPKIAQVIALQKANYKQTLMNILQI